MRPGGNRIATALALAAMGAALGAWGCGYSSSTKTDNTSDLSTSAGVVEDQVDISGEWVIILESCSHDRGNSEGRVKIVQDGETVTFVFLSGVQVERIPGTLSGGKLRVQGTVMRGEVETTETYEGVVKFDGTSITGTATDYDSWSKEEVRCALRMVRAGP